MTLKNLYYAFYIAGSNHAQILKNGFNPENNISPDPFLSIFWVNAGMNVGMETNQIYGTRWVLIGKQKVDSLYPIICN
jgi:hypothetical protein